MIEIRTVDTLGAIDYGWLKARYHFSFADYHDAKRIHWGRLRVLNDDKLAPNSGFPTHSHENVEIITYIHQGEMTHADNLGHHCPVHAGQIHIMSAGSGIEHSEFNRGAQDTCFFQLWIIPDQQNTPPSWHCYPFPKQNADQPFSIIASGFPEDNAPLMLNAHARLVAISLSQMQSTEYTFDTSRQAYLVATKGTFILNNHVIQTYDGVAIEDEQSLKLTALTDCEILLIDLA